MVKHILEQQAGQELVLGPTGLPMVSIFSIPIPSHPDFAILIAHTLYQHIFEKTTSFYLEGALIRALASTPVPSASVPTALPYPRLSTTTRAHE